MLIPVSGLHLQNVKWQLLSDKINEIVISSFSTFEKLSISKLRNIKYIFCWIFEQKRRTELLWKDNLIGHDYFITTMNRCTLSCWFFIFKWKPIWAHYILFHQHIFQTLPCGLLFDFTVQIQSKEYRFTEFFS